MASPNKSHVILVELAFQIIKFLKLFFYGFDHFSIRIEIISFFEIDYQRDYQ